MCLQLRSENSGDSTGSFEGLRRQARVRALTAEEKDVIAAYEKPSDMPYEERKRQLAALDRRVKNDPSSLPPGILAMYNDAYGSSTKKFELMSWPQPNAFLVYSCTRPLYHTSYLGETIKETIHLGPLVPIHVRGSTIPREAQQGLHSWTEFLPKPQ